MKSTAHQEIALGNDVCHTLCVHNRGAEMSSKILGEVFAASLHKIWGKLGEAFFCLQLELFYLQLSLLRKQKQVESIKLCNDFPAIT